MVALVDFLASGSGRVFERDRLRDLQFGFAFYPEDACVAGPAVAESPHLVQGVTTSSAV